MYKVSSTNSTGKAGSINAIRVYLESNGAKIAEVDMGKNRKPLAYIKAHKGKYRRDLYNQCMANGMSDEQFNELF